MAAVLGVLVSAAIQSRSERSLKALSLRNLLQWGIALNLHLMDNEDRLPEVGGSEVSADFPLAWYNSLPIYIGQNALTAMSNVRMPQPGEVSIWMDPATDIKEMRGAWGNTFLTLGMNYWLQPFIDEPAYKIYRLTDPARTIFLSQTAGPRPGLAPNTVVYRYGGRAGAAEATVLFCDGHTETMNRTSLSGFGTSDATYARWWRPFPEAPDPDYADVDIMRLPDRQQDRTAE